jgi:single-strand DNA-binding protein
MADLRMPDINNVTIAGNLIKDPTFRHTNTGGVPVANFTIASNRKFRDASGQWKEDVCIIGVVAWYKLAESCYQNLKKGSAVLVEGELQSRSFKTDDGFNRNIIEVKSRRIQFLNKKSDLASRSLEDMDYEPFSAYPEDREVTTEDVSDTYDLERDTDADDKLKNL